MKSLAACLLASLAITVSAAGQDIPPLAVMPAAAPVFSFADLQWGSTKTEVQRKLLAQGFRPDTVVGNDAVFKGEILSFPAFVVTAHDAQGRLAKVLVTLETPDRKARETYADMVTTLTKLYGAPKDKFEIYNTPYHKGDGYEDQAIRLGKGTLASFWIREGTAKSYLTAKVSESLSVVIAYESSLWSDEADRRKSEKTKIFGPPIR